MSGVNNDLDPIVGNWYRHLDKGQMFTVVALDERDGVIEVQHFDGDIEEFTHDGWRSMKLELAGAPEDWTGPANSVEQNDVGYVETDMSPREWREPLEELPRDDKEAWEDTGPRRNDT